MLMINETSMKFDDSNKLFIQPSMGARKSTSPRANQFDKQCASFNFRKYTTASQSMRVSVGSANYQNTPLVGASKGRSLHPRQ